MELVRDVRLAIRSLAKARGYTVSAVLTLAFGLALAATISAVVNAYLVRSLPYPAAERLYQVTYSEPGTDPPRDLEELDWASLSDVVEHPIAWDLDVFYLLGGEYPERAPGAWITPGFVNGLGVRPTLGRNFRPDEFEAGAPQVALISHALWMRRFAGDSGAIGRRIDAFVSDRPRDPEVFTIIGVLPENFWHINPYTEIFTPLRARTYPYYLRLRESVPLSVVEERVTALVRTGATGVPERWRPQLKSVHGEYVSRMKPMLLAIGAAVGVVLLIACSNVALLTVLRGMRRKKEIAVRLALGARRSQIARLLFVEASVLATTAAALAMLLAASIMRALAPAIERQLGRRVPGGLSALSLDWPVIAAVAALALLIAGALSLTPLLLIRRFSFVPALRQARGGGDGTAARQARSLLIGVEVAGSLALLTGAGLMVRTVVRLLDVDLGLNARQVVDATMAIREQSYPDDRSRAELLARLLASGAEVPGVDRVALSDPSPLVSYQPQLVRADERSAPARATRRAIAGDYFDLLGISLSRGRRFTSSDAGSAPVAIVSESAARLLWPGMDAVGQSLRVVERNSARDTATVARTVVGVVADVLQSPTDSIAADVYVPLLQAPSRWVAAIARTTRPASAWHEDLRRAMTRIDPTISVGTAEDLDVALREQLARPRFLVLVFALFGGFASLLGVMGLYAVIAYAVRQREHEVAVRIAVGASMRSITSLFLREGMLVTTLGLIAGVAGSVSLGRLLESQLFGIRAVDPVTLIGATLALGAAALLAVWWPARRAASTDPVIALRAEL